jgi:hypothetical protein
MNYLNFTPSPQSKSTAILESGFTGHFLSFNDHCKDKQLLESPLEVRLPNGAVIASTHTATLEFPYLSTAARRAHILPGLVQNYLLSVGKICDRGCVVIFTADKVILKHGMAKILDGKRDPDSGLWPLVSSPLRACTRSSTPSAHGTQCI